MANRNLSAAQSEALESVEAYLGKAHAEARAQLRAAGFDDDSEPHFECRLCDCQHFTVPGPFGRGCKTVGCGHSFFSHNLPT